MSDGEAASPSYVGGAGGDDFWSGGHVVVCGAGVIGACTAFYLGKRGVKVTVVERCTAAAAASGKAGGFLALDWCDGSPLGKLARASFRLHQRLAEELDGPHSYGYRSLDTVSVVVDERINADLPEEHQQQQQQDRQHFPHLPSWMDGPVRGATPIGSQATTAQVNPAQFTRCVLGAAEDRYAVTVKLGTVEEVKIDPYRMKVIGVTVDGSFIAADIVVIAMGPWSGQIRLISDLSRITGRKAHSIVLKPASELTPHALLLRYKTREGKQLAPEVYPRPCGEVYVSGMSEEDQLPPTADDVKPRPEAGVMLRRVAEVVSSQLRGAKLETEQACFMPLSEDGRPLIGKVPNAEGAYVATGHGYWGILNAPATGAFLSELIVEGGCKTLDLKYFDPARFSKLGRGTSLRAGKTADSF